jgi:hypothetical protein
MPVRPNNTLSYAFSYSFSVEMPKRKGDFEVSHPADDQQPTTRARVTTVHRNATGRLGGSTSYDDAPLLAQNPPMSHPSPSAIDDFGLPDACMEDTGRDGDVTAHHYPAEAETTVS